MDVKQFALKVQEMRKAQKEFFSARKSGMKTVSDMWLDRSRKLEREVDAAAAAILAPSTPQTIF
jgi:hypothetical protein